MHHHELLALPVDDLCCASRNPLTVRQLLGQPDPFDAHKGRPPTCRIVEIVVDYPVTIVIGLFDIVIVGEQIAGPNHQRRIKPGDKAAVILRGGIIVRWDDHQIDKALDNRSTAIGDGIDKAGRRSGVAIGGVAQRRCVDEFDRSVELSASGQAVLQRVARLQQTPPDKGDRIAVNVGIVAQQRRDRDVVEDILVDEHLIGMRHRRGILGIVEVQRYRGSIDAAFVVDHQIGEAGITPVVLVRRKGDFAGCGINHNRAVRGVSGTFELDRKAFNVEIVLEQIDDRHCDRCVFRPAQIRQARRVVAVIARGRQVVDWLVGDCRAGPGGAAMTIIDPIIEPRITVEIARRAEQHGSVFKQLGIAAVALPGCGDGQSIAITVDIVRGQLRHIDDEEIVFADRSAVLVQLKPVGLRFGRIVDRGDSKVHPPGRGRARSVSHDIVEPGRAPVISSRRNVNQPIGSDGNGNILVRLHRLKGQRVAIDIAVVGDQDTRIKDKVRTLGDCGNSVIHRHRRIVHPSHLDRYLGAGRAAFRRVGQIGEFGGAVEIGIGSEDNIAVRRQRDRTMRRAVNLADHHPVAVKVVREQALDPDRDRVIFSNGEAGIGQRGGNRAHPQVDLARVDAIAAIGQGVTDRRRAIVSAHCGVMNVALRIERGQSVFAPVNRDDPQRIAIGIEIVAQDIGRPDHQFGAGNGREHPVVHGRRGPVVKQLAERFFAPGYPVGESITFDPGGIGVQRIDYRQAIGAVAGKTDHHRVAAAVEPLNRCSG